MRRQQQQILRHFLFVTFLVVSLRAVDGFLSRPCSNFALPFSSTSLHVQPQKSSSLDGLIALVGSAVLMSTFVIGGLPAIADEYGVETEAPTIFTGENVMICKRRGPLGACLETVVRTDENDNDKAKKYFRDPTALLKEKEALLRESNDEGNVLIQKLRQQSLDNKERNDLYVQRKSFENDQSGYMGPFDRQVLIMNTDGKTFTVLQNPQAMRLKDSGFIVDRKFVKQPTEEELERALIADSSGLAGMIQGIFGGTSSE